VRVKNALRKREIERDLTFILILPPLAGGSQREGESYLLTLSLSKGDISPFHKGRLREIFYNPLRSSSPVHPAFAFQQTAQVGNLA
jgi:hypothetical protein